MRYASLEQYYNRGRDVSRHGTPEYKAWDAMIQRCTNPKCKQYIRYGARGIKVCDRWRSFNDFLADIGCRPSPEYSLDRIDNDGDYRPGNVRWATRVQQQRNRRANRLVVLNGKTMTMVEACEIGGIAYGTAKQRLQYGWNANDAFLTPPLWKR